MGVIFISHSSKNNAEAVAVRDWLRGEGYAETFLDLDPEHGLAPGQRWEEELQKAGERCLAVVVLISPDWCASKWCFHEFKFAKALGKKIFPILTHPTAFEDIPLELTSQFQMADISLPERHQDGLIRLRIGLQRAGLDPKHFTLPEGRPPYRGLKALEEEDAAIFFGRDAQITAGLDALRQMRGGTPQRILTIAAASGAGKSSFLKAGLLARLKRDEENFLVLPTWRPGRDALAGQTGLTASLGASSPQPALDALIAKQAAVADRFQSMAAAANETWRGTPPTLVLPLDQAEELFSADNATAEPAIQLLLDVLGAAPNLVVVATIRSDALGSLQADSRLAAQLKLFNLPALPPSTFRDVIEGPAALVLPPITVEPALTDRLIEDLDTADALPLLAFTLERLVTEHGADRRLSLSDYETGLGGVGGAINAAVEAALRKAEADPALPSTRHELDSLARAAFIPWLVQLDEADASPRRRVARLKDLPAKSHGLISRFVEERLLVAHDVNEQTAIEVSHEAVLRHWSGLADWISEERDNLELLQSIRLAAAAYAKAPELAPERIIHRGNRLSSAIRLLTSSYAPSLDAVCRGYLDACQSLADSEQRAHRGSESYQALTMSLDRGIALQFKSSFDQNTPLSVGHQWLSVAVKMQSAIVAIQQKFEHLGEDWQTVASGFVANGSALRADWPNEPVVVTAGHIFKSSWEGFSPPKPEESRFRLPFCSDPTYLGEFGEELLSGADLGASVYRLKLSLPASVIPIEHVAPDNFCERFPVYTRGMESRSDQVSAASILLGFAAIEGRKPVVTLAPVFFVSPHGPFLELHTPYVTGPGASGAPLFDSKSGLLVGIATRRCSNLTVDAQHHKLSSPTTGATFVRHAVQWARA